MKSPFPQTKAQFGNDWLDQILREDARSHIDDAGFTDALMSRLPERKSTRSTWHRWLPAMLGAAAALVAVGILPGSDVFLDGAADLVASDIGSPRVVAMLGTVVVFVSAVIAAVISER
jgi:hypothetical protein